MGKKKDTTFGAKAGGNFGQIYGLFCIYCWRFWAELGEVLKSTSVFPTGFFFHGGRGFVIHNSQDNDQNRGVLF